VGRRRISLVRQKVSIDAFSLHICFLTSVSLHTAAIRGRSVIADVKARLIAAEMADTWVLWRRPDSVAAEVTEVIAVC